MTWVKQRRGLTEGTHYECASFMTRKIIKEKRRWQTCCGIVTVTYLVYELMAVKLWTQWTMRLQQSVIECNGQHNIVKKREEKWRNKVILNCLKLHSSNFRIVLIETVGSIIQPGSLSLRLTEKISYWVAHHGGTCPWDRVMCDSQCRVRV